MEFKAKIRQLGKIKEAEISVKPLTIIAGENGCGKSFATKSLYALLGALNKDHVALLIARALDSVMRNAVQFRDTLKTPSVVDQEFIEKLFDEIIPELEELLASARQADFELQKGLANSEPFLLRHVDDEINYYVRQRQSVKKMEKPLMILERIRKDLNNTRSTLESHSETVIHGIAESLQDNFKKNFQISDLRSILNSSGSGSASIQVSGIGNMFIGRNGMLEFTFDEKGIDEIQRLDNIIFVDSPVYLKIRKGLTRSSLSLFASHTNRYLRGYPQHVDDLYQYLDSEYIDKPDFAELSEELQELLSGKLVVGKGGDIDYQGQDGHKIPLALTAMGISNIGLIELLIRNNIIRRGSFLIIDEPEAHLHPKWQVVLMDVLYKIARAGANVIVATHSIDMVKKVELLLKTDDDAQDYVALNPMPYTSGVADKSELEKVDQILQQLSSPFYEMYMESL